MSFGINRNSATQTSNQVANNLYNDGRRETQSGETTRVLTPEQLAAQSQITQLIHALATNPEQFLAPARNGARNDVNENYTGVADSLREQFLANPGGGGSGKYGTAALQSDLARRRDLSKVDTEFAVQKSQLPVTAAQLSQQLLSMNMGTRSTGTGTTEGSGSSTSTMTGTQKTTGTQFGGGVKLFGLG